MDFEKELTRYGYFTDSGDAFVVTNPNTPRPFDNFLFNDACYSNVHQTGVGCMDYQVGDTEGIQLFTGTGRICDYDVFGNEHLYSRLIYVRDNKTGEFWNVNWAPVCKNYDEYTCLHGMGYSEIKNSTDNINSRFFIGVPKGDDPVECWELELENKSDKERDLSVFVYNQLQFRFKWGFDSYGDMIYRTTEFSPVDNILYASKHPAVRPHDYLTAFLAADYPVAAYDGSYSHFIGEYGSLQKPAAVVDGNCKNSDASADSTIAALQFNLKLGAGDKKQINMVLGASNSKASSKVLADKYLRIVGGWRDACDNSRAPLEINKIDTPDKHLNRMINYWAKKATLYGATWCRWGYMGFRDIVQHGMGVCSFNPKRTKQILKEAMAHQYADGSAVRGWNPIDRKPYADSALWMEFTLNAYLKETGDLDFLKEKIPFIDNGEDTVLGHINRALDFLENNKGAHNLLLIKFGDWNDSLTQVGKEGRGESVWLSMAYAEALRNMAELSEAMGKYVVAKAYNERRENIKTAINTAAWDGEWYLRCFDDNGKPIGSSQNKAAKIFFEPQSWSLIAGIADNERAEIMLNALDKQLATPVGYRLLSPSFLEYDETIGRISAMEPDVAENGTVYTHTNIWLVLGLLKSGRTDLAYSLFKKNTPGYANSENIAIKSNTLPYQYANCYFGPGHKNNAFQMEFSWITGSVAWIGRTIENELLGVCPEYAGLTLKPTLSEFKEYSVKRRFRDADYNITFKNPCGGKGAKLKITADGVALRGNTLPIYGDNKMHDIQCEILE